MATTTALAALDLDSQVSKRTRHVVAVRLLPFVFILYIVNYVDRTNLAYAALGMTRDLGFSDQVFGLGAGIFFISYVALQVPGAMLVENWSARRTISLCMIVWGSLTVLTALVHTPAQLYLARFVLGAAEAGFFPGVVVYLSHWFIREDRAKAMSNFMGAIPLSFVLGSPLAGWILAHAWLGIKGWRWLFIVEGVPAVLLGASALFLLSDWPRDAKWLSDEQRLWLNTTLRREESGSAPRLITFQALRSPLILLLACVPFFTYFVSYSFMFWFPTILKRQSGFSDLRVGLVGTLPFLAYFLAMQLNGWSSDRLMERRWHTAVPVFIWAVALLALSLGHYSTSTMVALFMLVGVGGSYLPIFWAIPTEILSEQAAAPAVGIINAAGSLAGFAGPYAFGFLYSHGGSFSPGLALMFIAALAGGICTLLIPIERRERAGQAHVPAPLNPDSI